MRFAGQVCLVTGGASGIGAATAARFAREGAQVVIADLDGEGAQRVAKSLRADGAEAIGIRCDQTDAEDVAALLERVRAEFDRLDVCHANAGWCRVEPFVDIPAKVWKRHYDVNVTGTFLVCQAVARRMIECANGGSIVVTSSSGAVQPAAEFAAYCSAKAALNMMVAVMAYELGAHDITVNAVMPGVTETAMTEALLATGAREMFESESPLGRLGRPEDIAGAVAHLASEDARYVTGTSMLVDGGGGIGASWFVTDFRTRGETNLRLRHEVRPVSPLAVSGGN